MFYKVNEDKTFGGFYSKETVEEYKIENVFEISDELHKELVYKNNMEGYEIKIDSNDEIYAYKKELTIEELNQIKLHEKVFLYNNELELASKANVEFSYGIISQEEYDQVKEYIISINPYSGVKLIEEVERPLVFNRYEQK